MGLFSKLKSLDGFSQRPLQEKGGSGSNMERLQMSSITSSLSFNEGLKITHSNHGHSGRRASEAARSIYAPSSSSTTTTGIHSQQNSNTPRPESALPRTQTDETVQHPLRIRSVTNPNTRNQKLLQHSNTFESGLPIPFKGTNSDEENIQPSLYASTSQTSLQLFNGQRKGSAGSIPSLNASGTTAGSPFSTIEGEVMENSAFPKSRSLVTSSLRPNDHDSPRLFSDSWHSPNPSPSVYAGARFKSNNTREYDDEGVAEEIIDDVQSSDTMYAKVNGDQNASLYSNGIDTSSQTSFNKRSLGASSLRKASSRLKSGFMRSTKRPSTADASMINRKASTTWDLTRRRDSHSIFQSSTGERDGSSDFRLGIPRRSTDSLTSTISIGSRDTMTKSTTIIPSRTAAIDSKLPSPDQEIIKNEDSFPAPSRQRARASSSTSSQSIKAVIRASLSRPISRSGLQTNQHSPSLLVSPKSQVFEFASQSNGQPHSPAINSHSLPSQQQQGYSQSRQRLWAHQAGTFQGDQERIIARNLALEKVSLSPAPRKRSKSRARGNSNEYEKSFENAEPVPEIPLQYRDERRSSIATTSLNSEDHANGSTLSSEDFDSIDHKSINDDIPGFRTSISTTTTNSVQQHTPQSSISVSSSMAHLGGGEERIQKILIQQRNQQQENIDKTSHPSSSWKTQTIDPKYQLLTPESFSSTSRSRLREIHNISSNALRLNGI